jgi:AraC-like DNA-binding protein
MCPGTNVQKSEISCRSSKPISELFMDPLSHALRSVRLKGGVFLDVQLTEPWCLYSQVFAEDCAPILKNPTQIISYHYVTRGRMLAWVADGQAQSVQAGEIILLPRNDRHLVASGPGIPPLEGQDLVRPQPNGGLARLVHGGGGAPARLICGFLGCEDEVSPLIASLPAIIKIDIREAASRCMIEASMEYAVKELTEGRSAESEILARLSELLFVEAVRKFADSLPDGETSWLKGLRDPQIGQALAVMHHDIARPWTAAELAELAAMSRSAFMARFTERLGVSPIRYLTLWRLKTAKLKLAETTKSVSQIAFEVGYESEDAFSRAFKREYRLSPARSRETGAEEHR